MALGIVVLSMWLGMGLCVGNRGEAAGEPEEKGLR